MAGAGPVHCAELPGVVRGSKSLEGRMETLGNSQLCPGLGSRKVDAETQGSSDRGSRCVGERLGWIQPPFFAWPLRSCEN